MTRLATKLVALGNALTWKALVATGLRRPPDGWRRTVGILLRSEPTRFALSAFGLRAPGEPAAALRTYLASQPDAHFHLEWRNLITLRHRTSSVDVVVLTFDTDGELCSIEPHLAPEQPVSEPSVVREASHRALVEAYNRTRTLPEVERTRKLQKAVADPYGRRLLSACCLSFESVDLTNPGERFRPPQFHLRRTLGGGYLSVVMRPSADQRTTDLWVSAHHVGLDGVPLQELVAGLELAWGVAEPPVFPAVDRDRPFMAPRPCSHPGERDVHEMLAFVDFSPVFALRDALNARFASELSGPVTFGALLAWLLTREPEFAGVRVASTVDVAASGGYDRDVDVVPLRPADFARTGSDEWAGFVEFIREFNRLIALSRTRMSPLRREMQAAGLLPPWVHMSTVRAVPGLIDDTFGSLCVTIVREAKVFVAPMTDLGLEHGFFAIGNAGLPAHDGSRVTAVSIKGNAAAIAEYPAILRRVVNRSAGLRAV